MSMHAIRADKPFYAHHLALVRNHVFKPEIVAMKGLKYYNHC